MFWWLHGLAEDKLDYFCGCCVGLGHNNGSDCFRGRLTTTRVLWSLQGLDEDHKDGFCVHCGKLRTQNNVTATGVD